MITLDSKTLLPAALVAALTTAACDGGESTPHTKADPPGADALGETDRSEVLLQRAVPTRKQLSIQLPEAAGTNARVSSESYGEPYLLPGVSELAFEVNTRIDEVFDSIDAVTSQPPTATTETYVLWGPWDYAVNDTTGATYRFYVVFESRGTYSYALEGKPLGAGDGDYVAVLSGVTTYNADDLSIGYLSIDWEATRTLDAGITWGGTEWISFDTTHQPRALGHAYADNDGYGTPYYQTYDSGFYDDGAGYLVYASEGGQDPAGNPFQSGTIVAQWTADSQGRVDLSQTGGELGSFLWEASECWDEALAQVYYSDNIPEIPDEGSADSCAFNAASSTSLVK